MYFLVGLIIVLLLLIAIFFLYSKAKERINFYITGFDSSFTLSDLNLLWKVSQLCGIPQPTALFYSLPILTKCMNQITAKADENNEDAATQLLITKLFNYRTKLQNKSDEKKGVDSTKTLDVGQKLRIIYPGRGVFASEIVANGKDLIISVPKQKDLIVFSTNEWIGQTINVYFWRKSDARYVFDTVVLDQAIYIGKTVLKLKHSNQLVRTQKRKAIRAKCNIEGKLFIIKEKITDFSTIETQNGYKCKIEDISEAGALVRIGGQGVPNVQIKLQFTINNMLIIMFGEIRTVEFNQEINQSLLHFECTHIDTVMKNEVLKYVYNILPDNEKEILAALSLVAEDEESEEKESAQMSTSTTTTAPIASTTGNYSINTSDNNYESNYNSRSYDPDYDDYSFNSESEPANKISFDTDVEDMDELNIF